MSNVNMPMVGEFNSKEFELMNYQKDILSKLEKVGFGIKVEEDTYLPIPDLLTDDTFPIELFQQKNNLLLCFNCWKEVEEYSNTIN